MHKVSNERPWPAFRFLILFRRMLPSFEGRAACSTRPRIGVRFLHLVLCGSLVIIFTLPNHAVSNGPSYFNRNSLQGLLFAYGVLAIGEYIVYLGERRNPRIPLLRN
jgi:hypothetical protein